MAQNRYQKRCWRKPLPKVLLNPKIVKHWVYRTRHFTSRNLWKIILGTPTFPSSSPSHNQLLTTQPDRHTHTTGHLPRTWDDRLLAPELKTILPKLNTKRNTLHCFGLFYGMFLYVLVAVRDRWTGCIKCTMVYRQDCRTGEKMLTRRWCWRRPYSIRYR